jgi:hypothetical protein
LAFAHAEAEVAEVRNMDETARDLAADPGNRDGANGPKRLACDNAAYPEANRRHADFSRHNGRCYYSVPIVTGGNFGMSSFWPGFIRFGSLPEVDVLEKAPTLPC